MEYVQSWCKAAVVKDIVSGGVLDSITQDNRRAVTVPFIDNLLLINVRLAWCVPNDMSVMLPLFAQSKLSAQHPQVPECSCSEV